MHRYRYVGMVAVIVALLGGLSSASNAIAATPGSVSVSDDGFDITGTLPGTNITCTSHLKGVVDTTLYNWSKVEWTSNPCGYQIQDRSWCLEGSGAHFDSGIVSRTNLWDQANCNLEYFGTIWEADWRFRTPFADWSAWKKYWGGV